VEAISLKHLGQSNYNVFAARQMHSLHGHLLPASTTGIPVTWEMFKQTMLTNFAHPDRQHYQAREQLHKIWQRTSQSATDYVRTFNSLVQRAGQILSLQLQTKSCSFTLAFFQNVSPTLPLACSGLTCMLYRDMS
jgi:hypothetical protein